MARPREPIALIEAKGKKHLTKSEIEERKKSELKVSNDEIKAPLFLMKKQREKFDKIASTLIEVGIMTNLDCDILARYIQSEEEYIKITKEMRKVKFKSEKENPEEADAELIAAYCKYDGLSKMQIRYLKVCNDCARELGLTISSRCKLVVPIVNEEKPVNKYLEHLNELG